MRQVIVANVIDPINHDIDPSHTDISLRKVNNLLLQHFHIRYHQSLSTVSKRLRALIGQDNVDIGRVSKL